MRIQAITWAVNNRGKDFEGAALRLKDQANKANIFDDFKIYNEPEFIADKEFWGEYSNFVLTNPYYGFYIAHPYLCNKHIQKMNEGDVLIYIDSGCEVNCYIKQRHIDRMFNYMLKKLDKDLIYTPYTSQPEIHYTKMDTIHHFGFEKYIDSIDEDLQKSNYLQRTNPLAAGQIQTTYVIFKVTAETKRICSEWWNTCLVNDMFHLKETPSVRPEHKYFKEHRWEQSIFSLLCKKNNYNKFCPLRNELFYPLRSRHPESNLVTRDWSNFKLHHRFL
jgi:hypothetical protein